MKKTGKFEALRYAKQLEKKLTMKEEEKGERVRKAVEAQKEKDGEEGEGGKEKEGAEPTGKVSKAEEKKILALLKVAEHEIAGLKDSIDTTVLENMLADANEALAAGNDKEAFDIAERLQKKIENVVENHIEKTFFDCDMLIKELEIVGVDTSSSAAILEEGKKALEAKDLKNALHLANKVGKEVEKLRYTQVMEVVTYAESILETLRTFNVDVTEKQEQVEKIKQDLDEKNYENALESAILIEGELNDFRAQKFEEVVYEIRDLIKKKEQTGENMAEAKRMLERTVQALEMKDFNTASDYIIECKFAVDKEAGQKIKTQSTINMIKEMVKGAADQGMKSKRAMDTIAEAQALLNKDDHDGAVEKTKDAETALLEDMKAYDELRRSIEEISNNIAQLKTVGGNLSEAAPLLDEARNALAEGDVELAKDSAHQAKEEASKGLERFFTTTLGTLQAVARDVKDKLSESRIREAVTFIRQGKMDRGIAIIEQVKAKLNESMSQIKDLTDGVAELRARIDEIGLMGGDTSRIQNLMERVDSSMTHGDFTNARKTFKLAKRIVERTHIDLIYSKITESERSLLAFEDIGIMVKPVEDLMDNAWTSFASGDHKAAVEQAEVLSGAVMRYKQDYTGTMDALQMLQYEMHNAANMGIKIVDAEAVADETRNALLAADFNRGTRMANDALGFLVERERTLYERQLDDTTALLEEMEQDFEIYKARDHTRRAKAIAEIGVWSRAYEELKDAADYLTDLRERYRNLEQEFHQMEGLLAQASDLEVNDAAFRKGFEEAETAFKDNRLEDAIKLLAGLRADVEEVYTNQVNDKVALLENTVKVCEPLNIDLHTAREVLKDVKNRLKEKDFKTAFEDLSDSQGALVTARQKHGEATDALASLASKIESAEAAGIEIDDVKDLFDRSTMALESGNFDEALEHALEGDSNLISHQKEILESFIKERVVKRIDEAKGYGARPTDAQRLLEMARGAMDAGDFEEAQGLAKKAEETAIGATAEQVKAKLDRASGLVEKLIEDGVQPGQVVELLDEASEATAKNEFHHALERISAVEGEAMARREVYDDAQGHVKGFEAELADVATLGVKTKSVEETMKAVDEAFKAGDYERSMELVKDARDLLHKQRKGHDDSKNMLEAVLIDIERCVDFNIDTTEFMQDLSGAYDAIDTGDYEKALGTIDTVKKKVMDGKFSFMEGRLDGFLAQVKEQGEKGDDVSELKNIYNEAQDRLEEKDYDGMTKAIAEGNARIKSLEDRFIAAGDMLADLDTLLREKEGSGIILLKARGMYEAAENTLNKRDYKRFSGMLDDIRAKAEGAVKEYNSAKELLERAKGEIDITYINVDVTRSKKVLKEAEEEFDTGRYDKARALGDEVIDEMVKVQTEKVADSLEEAETMVGELEEEGVPRDVVADLLDSAASSFSERKFKDAWHTASEAKDAIKATLASYRAARDAFEDMSKRIEEARSVGVDVATANDMAASAEESMKVYDYETAHDMFEESGRILRTSLEDFFTALEGTVDALISKTKKKGVPVQRSEGLFVEAQGLYDGGDVLGAYNAFKKAEEQANRSSERFRGVGAKLVELSNKVREAEGYNLQVDEPKAVLEECKGLLLDAKFDEVEKRVVSALGNIEKLWNLKVASVLEEADEVVNVARKEGAITIEIEDMFNNAKAAFEAKGFTEALTICQTVKETLGGRMGEFKAASAAIAEVRAKMAMAGDMPVQLDDAKHMLESADKMMSEGTLEAALDMATEALGLTTRAFEDFFVGTVSELEKLVTDLTDGGVRVKEAGFIDEVLTLAKNGAYDKAWALRKESTDTLVDLQEAHRTAMQMVQAASDEIFNVGGDVEITAAMEELDAAYRALDEGNYDEIAARCESVKARLVGATESYLDDALARTREEFKRISLDGQVDLSHQLEELEATSKNMADGQFSKALETVARVRSEAIARRMDFERAKDVVAGLEPLFKSKELNLHILKGCRQKAKSAFERDYRPIIEGKEPQDRMSVLAVDLIQRFQVAFEESIPIDIDTSLGLDLITKAEARRAEGKYSEAVELAHRCLLEVLRAEKDATIRTIIGLQERVYEFGEMDIDPSMAENFLERARESLLDGEVDRALKYIHECNETMKSLGEQAIKTKDVLNEAHAALTIADHLGVSTVVARDLFDSAKTTLRQNDFETAHDLSMQAMNDVGRNKASLVHDTISATSAVIEDIRGAGISVSRAEDLLKHSKELAGLGDHLRAQALAEKASAHAVAMRDKHLEFQDLISSTNEKVEYAKGLGMDISVVQMQLAEMNTAVQDGNHARVEELTTSIESNIYTGLVKICNEAIELCEQRLRVVEDIGAASSVEGAQRLIESAKAALEDEEFDAVMETTDECKAMIGEALKEEATRKVAALEARIGEDEAMGLDTTRAQAAYQKASEALESGNFGIIKEQIATACDMLDDERVKVIKKTASKAETLLRAGKRHEMAFGNTDAVLKSGTAALDAKRTKEAFELVNKAYQEVRTTYEDFINKILETSRKVLETAEAKEGGAADASKLRELFGKTQDLMEEENFDRAVFYGKQCSRECDRLQFKHITGEIRRLEGLIDEAEAAGGAADGIANAKQMLLKVRSFLGAKDYQSTTMFIVEVEKSLKTLKGEPAPPAPKVSAVAEKAALEQAVEVESVIEDMKTAAPDVTEEILSEPEPAPAPEGAVPAAAIEELEQAAATAMDEVDVIAEAMTAAGLDARPVKALADQALDAVGKGDFKTALALAADARELATDLGYVPGKPEAIFAEPAPAPQPVPEPEELPPPEPTPAPVPTQAVVAPPAPGPVTVPEPVVTPVPSPEQAEQPAAPPPPSPTPTPTPSPEQGAEEDLPARINTFNSKVLRARAVGANVKEILDSIERAKGLLARGDAQGASNTFRNAESALLEALRIHKEVTAVCKDAENICNLAGQYGVNVEAAKELLKQSVAAKTRKPEDAKTLAAQAKSAAIASMEGVYPYMAAELRQPTPLPSGQWGTIDLVLSNLGNIHAVNVTIEVPDIQTKPISPIPKIDIGQSVTVQLELVPAVVGVQTIRLMLTFTRDVDNRIYAAEIPLNVQVK